MEFQGDFQMPNCMPTCLEDTGTRRYAHYIHSWAKDLFHGPNYPFTGRCIPGVLLEVFCPEYY